MDMMLREIRCSKGHIGMSVGRLSAATILRPHELPRSKQSLLVSNLIPKYQPSLESSAAVLEQEPLTSTSKSLKTR